MNIDFTLIWSFLASLIGVSIICVSLLGLLMKSNLKITIISEFAIVFGMFIFSLGTYWVFYFVLLSPVENITLVQEKALKNFSLNASLLIGAIMIIPTIMAYFKMNRKLKNSQ